MSERKMRLVDSEDAAFIVKNAPEYIEGMVTSATLERWRKALRGLTLQPDGEAVQIDESELLPESLDSFIKLVWQYRVRLSRLATERDAALRNLGDVQDIVSEVVKERDALRSEVERQADSKAVLRDKVFHLKDELARLRALIPPHPIEYAENDTDRGRVCGACGFPVPGGYAHAHAVWCQTRRDAVRGRTL